MKPKEGYLVEQKFKGKWTAVMKWKEGIMGWTPAVSAKKSTAERLKKKLMKTGIGTGVSKEGKSLMKKIPIRVIPVTYTITGKMGSREFDFKRKRKK